MNIKSGPTKTTNGNVTMTEQPRSIMDRIMGRTTVNYSREVPTIKMNQTKSNKFKPVGPTSNGIGVGM